MGQTFGRRAGDVSDRGVLRVKTMAVAQQGIQSFHERFTLWACQPKLSHAPGAQYAARFSLIDTLACMRIGANERQSQVMALALEASGDEGTVSPIGGGRACSLYGAALLNGARAHAIDFDDYEIPGSTHVSAPIFSALLALAQRHSMTVDAFGACWIVGFEAIVRIGSALGYGHYDKGWHATATLGPIGVAAACARALGLSAEQMAHAMTLATSSSAGMKSQFGFDAKALHVGLAAEAGLRAAILAQSGATGNIDIWDAPQGMMDLYGTDASIGFQEMMLTMREGEATDAFPVARKFWPSCSYTHRVIPCAQALAADIQSPAQIERIYLRMPEAFHRVSCFGAPTTANEARFSAVYCVVTGLLTGQVLPEDFTIERFSDPARQALCRRVELDLYPLPQVPPDQLLAMTPEKVSVKLKAGGWIEYETNQVPGSAERPMTQDQLMAKYEACGGSPAQAEAFMQVAGDQPLAGCAVFATA